jgi:hypothetical protein
VLNEDEITATENLYKEDVEKEFLATHSSIIPVGNKVVLNAVDQVITTNQVAGSEVSKFTVSGTSTFVVVSYNTEELNQLINKEINQQIDVSTDKVLPVSKDPLVSVSSYDRQQNVARIAISQPVVLTIDAGVEKLSPQKFLGMKKDEIEQYVKSLNHVAGVEVRFSPSWLMSSAPQVSDKIKVSVKNLK